jgi:hypothetical protein
MKRSWKKKVKPFVKNFVVAAAVKHLTPSIIAAAGTYIGPFFG